MCAYAFRKLFVISQIQRAGPLRHNILLQFSLANQIKFKLKYPLILNCYMIPVQ